LYPHNFSEILWSLNVQVSHQYWQEIQPPLHLIFNDFIEILPAYPHNFSHRHLRPLQQNAQPCWILRTVQLLMTVPEFVFIPMKDLIPHLPLQTDGWLLLSWLSFAPVKKIMSLYHSQMSFCAKQEHQFIILEHIKHYIYLGSHFKSPGKLKTLNILAYHTIVPITTNMAWFHCMKQAISLQCIKHEHILAGSA
jgi:hypothetical protein